MKQNRIVTLLATCAAILFVGNLAAAADVSVYVAPITCKGDISSKTEKKINKYVPRYIAGNEGFKLYDKDNLKKIVRKSRTRKKIARCGHKYKCLLKASKGSGLDVIITGYYKVKGSKVKAYYRVIDVAKGKVITKERGVYDSEKDARKKKEHEKNRGRLHA